MDHILGSLYIGNIDDAHTPASNISALLWTALESKLDPLPQGVVLGRIPLREYTEAVPMDIESGIAWLERYLPPTSNSRRLSSRNGTLRFSRDCLSLLRPTDELR